MTKKKKPELSNCKQNSTTQTLPGNSGKNQNGTGDRA